MPARIIPGGPEKHERDSWKRLFRSILIVRLKPVLKISEHPVHNIPHVEKILVQCHRTRKSDSYVVDKGYDSEDIHKLIRVDLNSYSLIPVRTDKENSSLDSIDVNSHVQSIWHSIIEETWSKRFSLFSKESSGKLWKWENTLDRSKSSR